MATTTCRAREKLSFQPTWTETQKKWSKGFINQHKWRVDRMYGDDDLLQEAWITFNYVANCYPRCMCPEHFNRLFKRAMINKMNDRSCRVKRRRDSPEGAISCDITEVLAGRIGETTNGGYMAAILDEVPEELKLVMSMALRGEFDTSVRKRNEPRKNLNMKMREFLNKKGIFSAYAQDPVAAIKALVA
jgi:hypothetical protein